MRLPHIIIFRSAVISAAAYLLFYLNLEDARLKRCRTPETPYGLN